MAENSASAYPEGVPCWVDAQLPDVAAGKRFYGGLFGWTFDAPGGDRPPDAEPPDPGPRDPGPRDPGPRDSGPRNSRALARLGGDPVAALAPKRDGRMPTVWTVYFATSDAVALAGRIRAGGGQLVTAPHPADGGTAALAADPQGAVFGLWQPAGHAGFARRHEPSTFTWAELYTRDTEAADAFYGHLFHDALFGPGAEPDFGRAPVSAVFPAEMPPHFLVHFLVADVEAALGTVARLGGRVQVPPFETSYGGVAVAGDDQGASFALLQR
ncbi:VOC family protein [Streptomyces ziwulingensis]|uniref:VOC family protein n=1 Tax=Streptomyces ziwulingensis TaxID=1045501 RepID=A0ABP9CE93_9ACTN